MNRNQFLVLFCGLTTAAFLGCYLAPSAVSVRRASAQVPPPIVENQQVVPNAGLRFVDEQGRVLAILSRQGNASMFTLIDGGGRPALLLQGSEGGRVTLGTTEGGGELRIQPAQGTGSAAFAYQAQAKGILFAGPGGNRSFELNTMPRDATLSLYEASGRKGLDLKAGMSGGEIALFGVQQTQVISIQSVEGAGILKLTDPKKNGVLTASGSGTLAYDENQKKVWRFPPAQ